MKEESKLFLIDGTLNFEQIGERLESEGIIRYSETLPVILQLQGFNQIIKIGEYRLRPSMTPKEIVRTLLSGKVETRTFQVLAGMNTREISKVIALSGLIEEEAILAATSDPDLLARAGIRAQSFEGYLGAGVYEMAKPIKPSDIIWEMLAEAEKAWLPDYREQASKLRLSRHDILTLASIIQAYSLTAADSKKFSSVFHNRMREGLPLQSAAALEYGLGKEEGELSEEDLETPNAYNTFLNYGLPPGPINTPSRAAVEAALFPEQTDFLYILKVGDRYEYFINKADYDLARRRYMIE